MLFFFRCFLFVQNYIELNSTLFSLIFAGSEIRELKDQRKITTANFDLAKFNGHRKSCICVFKGPKQFLTQGVIARSYHLSTLDVNF